MPPQELSHFLNGIYSIKYIKYYTVSIIYNMQIILHQQPATVALK